MSSYQDRLIKAIPGGSHTYSKGFDQFSSNAPQILERGKGAYVFDPSDQSFLDYGMGLRSVTLGYSDDDINNAAIRQISNGNNLTRPSTIELEAAELLIDLIPSADMVKFAKNGSNVTTAALKLARAYTNNPYVCIPRQHPFFSFDDWFIGTTPVTKGIPPEHYSLTLMFDYGDIQSLEKLFVENDGQIAAVMLEPATSDIPCPPECNKQIDFDPTCLTCENRSQNFLVQVQDLCKKYNALFILDEMITGFRWDLKGAQHYFGVTPDLTTFGKAMANGFSLSALTGRKDVMQLASISQQGQERLFLLSSTHGAEMASLGAFVETVSKYKSRDVCKHLWKYGTALRNMFENLALETRINKHFVLSGPSISMSYSFLDRSGAVSPKLKTLFQQELIKNSVLMPWISFSLSHGERELDITSEAVRKAFLSISNAINCNDYSNLVGEPIKRVFRRYN